MEDSTKKKWGELVFRPGPSFGDENASIAAEDLAAAFIDAGAAGVTTEGDSRLRCYFERFLPNSPSPSLGGGLENTLIEVAGARGFILSKRSDVPARNWVQECEDVWQPLQLGRLTIQPVLSLEVRPTTARPAGEIRLIPGFGFGTGHHATTSMILEALQNSLPPRPLPRSALDVGTGSAILALGIRELFNIPVLGVDIDPLALQNAHDNLALNETSTAIDLSLGGLEVTHGTFDLIVANLYAEVLESLRDGLFSRLSHGGTLIVSGIAESLLPRVLEHYQSPNTPSPHTTWQVVHQELRDGWGMVVYRKS